MYEQIKQEISKYKRAIHAGPRPLLIGTEALMLCRFPIDTTTYINIPDSITGFGYTAIDLVERTAELQQIT